ncbi:PqqD family protein [Sphingobacterium thermophilum]|uniref:Coenzyme PQQ synthesis protein D (PqqD) n=1 Tax=Sphingobacterium thermophilum TaxID=768534 RepID=A0ABP8R0N1_9SPHI
MRLKEGLTVRKVGKDYVIVSPEQGMVDMSKVYTLNETAAWLWEQLDGKDFEVDDMIALVREQYDVDALSDDELKKDMLDLIQFFKDNALIIQ